jgi:hypothetical protein
VNVVQAGFGTVFTSGIILGAEVALFTFVDLAITARG